MIYPYLLHPIDGLSDIQTPYGYGGPLFVGDWPADHTAAALTATAEYLRSLRAVAEFIRCHTEWADHDALIAAGYRTFQVRTNVECDLTLEDFTSTWAPAARRNLRKATSAGLSFRPAESDADWSAFESLYAATADRLDMSPAYRFDHAYFTALRAVPNVRLTIVEKQSRPLAAAIFFLGGRLAHYHLGASDFSHQQDRPNDLLYLAMATLARQAACQRIVWGGGMSNDPDDSLFRFKTHFGQIRRAVHCAGRVLDPEAFEYLVAQWRQKNPGREPGLFLKYRT
jgi:lipid II:glycine glycyltransferase (peptidoglycan interpeptide bridge formation enzyme)